MDSLINVTATIALLLVVAGCVVALTAMRPWRRYASPRSGSPALPRLPEVLPRTTGEPEFLPRLPYTRTAHLLTGDQRTLFAALNAAAPDDLAVLPHVPLSDVLSVEPRTTQPERYQERIRGIFLDFVLCDAQTTTPRLAVLFAQPGTARRTAFIDAALIGAGIPVLRLARDEPLLIDALAFQIAVALGTPVQSKAPVLVQSDHTEHLPKSTVPTAPQVVVARTPVRYACGRCHRDIAPRDHRCSHCGATLAG